MKLYKIIPLLFIVSGYSFAQNPVEVPKFMVLNYGFEYSDILSRPVNWNPQNTKGQYLIQLYVEPLSKGMSMGIFRRDFDKENNI